MTVSKAIMTSDASDDATNSVNAYSRYGIVSSATLDQTSRFQDMADDSSTGQNGARTIILPAGEFHISSPIDFDVAADFGRYPGTSGSGVAGLTILGQGMFATTIHCETAGVSGFRVFESSAARQHNNFTMGNIGFEGPGLSNDATAAVQLGGVSADASDIIAGGKLFNLRANNFSTGLILDDVTSLLLERLQLEGYNYGIEFGFNTDVITLLQCRIGSASVSQGVAATTINVDTEVVVADTTDLRVGMHVKGANFPYGTKIASITDSTHFETDTNATATSGDTLYFTLGKALSMGAGPFIGNAAAVVNGQGNCIEAIGCWFMKNQEVLSIGDNHPSSPTGNFNPANVKFDSSYFESNARTATLGSGSYNATINIGIWDNCHFSQSSKCFKDYAIYEDGNTAGSCDVIIRNCRSDENSAVPWVRLRNQSSVLQWENNILPVSTGNIIDMYDSSAGHSPAVRSLFYLGVAALNASPVTLGVTGALTPLPPPKAHNVFYVGLMTGNVTINNPSAGYQNNFSDTQRISFMFEQNGTGGHTVAWGTDYVFTTAWSNTGNTADKISTVEFAAVSGKLVQVSPANVWS